MTDSNTSSANIVVSKINKLNNRFTPLTIIVIIVVLVVVVALASRFFIDRSNTKKVQTAILSAQRANNHNQPNIALDQLSQVSGIKMSIDNQESILTSRATAYAGLGDYGSAVKVAEEAYRLVPANNSLLLSIADFAQSNNDPKTEIAYYQKAITAMEKIPTNKRGFTYNSDLSGAQAQLKALLSQ